MKPQNLTTVISVVPTEFCQTCEEGRACPNYHVYAIELRREVLVEHPESKSLYLTGLLYSGDLPPDKRVFYVGETTHSPECRHSQHIADSHTRKEFSCNCKMLDTNPGHANVPRKYIAPSKGGYVRDYSKELHPPDFLGGEFQNPTVKNISRGQAYPGSRLAATKASREAERRLGCYLRLLGHAVYWGPKSLGEDVCNDSR